ncbi:MAG TPA: AraC family transcriptional regulator [Firmicutes bacterium]|jgi:AraC family transcriptional regulator, arabinose operon regulatory protein|nr:AraC family transcriptional regulator [Bacillota bacterium]
MLNHIFPVITESEKMLPLYLDGVGCHYHQDRVVRPEGYPTFQWIQCHKGQGELIIKDQSYPVGPGQGMFLYPNETHEYFETNEPWEVDWIGFSGCLVESLVHQLGFNSSNVFSVLDGEIILAKMRHALQIAGSGDPFKGLQCSGIIYELLLDLYKYTSHNAHSNDDSILQQHSRLKPVLDYMEENFSHVVTLEYLANTLRITPQHLCLLFKSTMKIRPFEHLNRIRINKSKDLMFARRDLDIKTISEMVGFDNVSYFCAVFKQIEGMSPGQFRKLHGV